MKIVYTNHQFFWYVVPIVVRNGGKVMLAMIQSAALYGIDAYIVRVEVDLSNGIPAFEIVGLPDSAVKESRERVRTAIKNSGLLFPSKRITVNLAPADTKKEGAAFAACKGRKKGGEKAGGSAARPFGIKRKAGTFKKRRFRFLY